MATHPGGNRGDDETLPITPSAARAADPTASSPGPVPRSAPPSGGLSHGTRAQRRSAAPDLGTRYQLVAEAGSGGMGTVAEALDTLLDRRVAIKFLRNFEGEAARATVIREARAMAALRHRSICRVLEVVIDPPLVADPESWHPFIVMEWVAGSTLASAWRGMPFERRLAMFEMVAEGVAAMHSAGLVHRDLKPANILCDSDGVPVIVDFGLSSRSGDGDEMLGGTPGWSAPEQFEPGSEVGASADVFALGVLFYNMLTDTTPFDGASTADILKKTREGDAPLPESFVPGIAAPLQRIALAAIDPDPSQRYADAAAMLADIRRFKSGETVLARPRRLYTRFADEIERHLSDVERWHKQGLATEQEVRAIRDGLRVLQRPESPWILDSRRLSWSQVAMYLGGWLLVLAMTVGIWNTTEIWRERGQLLPWLVPGVLALAVTAAGLVLAWIGEQRAALGFLFTSALAIPIAAWQFLRSEEILKGKWSERFGSGSVGFSHDQQLVLMLLGLGLALAYRRRVPSTAFTLLAVLFGLGLAHAIGIRVFSDDGEMREVIGQIPRWLLVPAAAVVLAGVWFDARSNRPTAELLSESAPRDGGPLLVTGLVFAILMLSLGAYIVPEWFWMQGIAVDAEGAKLSEPTVAMRASAFLATGVLLLATSLALGVRPTPLRDWCSRAMRWLVPSFLLLPIVWLELEEAAPGWGFWMLVLGAVSLGLVAASAALQWRPFLISGLLGFLDLFVRAFMRIDSELEDGTGAKLWLMLGVAVAGVVVMTAASYPDRVVRAFARLARRARVLRAASVASVAPRRP
jgi:serine/threonine protein kinase